MSRYAMKFLGVGNAYAKTLGTASAVFETDDQPSLMIDCGPESLTAFRATYGMLPPAIFVTHAHFDHIGGLEGLFYRLATMEPRPPLTRLYVPVPVLHPLQARLAVYPNLLAEGGANFWDAFQLIPVTDRFWHRNLLFDCFAVRHHEYQAAFGLALRGRFLFSGDTRPIPETVNRFGSRGEHLFHDCGLTANPAHTGLDDIIREYRNEQQQRMVLYHYESEAAGRQMEHRGFRIARAGERFELSGPSPEEREPGRDAEILTLPGASIER